MDKISDFFHDIKDRATNPLISSFVIAWFLWNWKIPVGIIFLKPETLVKLGFGSMIDFIQHEINNVCRTIVYPLISAVLYTGLIPVVKWGISALYTYFRTRSNRSNLTIAGTGIVPGSLFLKIRDEYEKEKRRISEMITNEAHTIEENFNLKSENENLKHDHALAVEHTNEQITFNKSLMDKFDRKTLDGIWIFQQLLTSGGTMNQTLRFDDGQITELKHIDGQISHARIGEILKYLINIKSNELALVIRLQNNSLSNQFLKYDDKFSILKGEEEIGFLEYSYIKESVWRDQLLLDAITESVDGSALDSHSEN